MKLRRNITDRWNFNCSSDKCVSFTVKINRTINQCVHCTYWYISKCILMTMYSKIKKGDDWRDYFGAFFFGLNLYGPIINFTLTWWYTYWTKIITTFKKNERNANQFFGLKITESKSDILDWDLKVIGADLLECN